MRIAVLGAGGWGTTLAIILYHNGHDVTLWEYKKAYAKVLNKTRENKDYLPGIPLPKELVITYDLGEACTNKHMIVSAIPTQFVRSVFKQLKKINFRNTTFVSVSKGIERGTHLTVSKVIGEELPDLPIGSIGVLSGPSHAEEVARKIPTAVVAAADDEETSKQIQAAFMNSYFRVYSSTDIVGVELGGALKNVIAIGAGIIDGAGFGDNTKALIMTRGIAEITRLGLRMGAQKETFSGLSGIGDLIVTCMSRHSRNRFVGEQIGKGLKLTQVLKSMTMVAEGVETSRSVYELAESYGAETPIAKAVYEILFEDKDPIKATYELMTRDMKPEHYH
ncbi:MAG: NAD(P)H-dependent glycerol-3-phosphate dehydrogenase [Ignavibacteriales bacterium]|nr:NAD(P)H-dependent glycerol-3-phosphate dehydrogenase [Ignavibacteriales bacterium]MCF8314822.1 NAD(P)H-dependent glycerol-3-phosphate dehydrogenase [Ignavibacteriales bacterium]MCF8436229.1 NAD(P)H-dependent glycerol-3-phosphate dehydrogenase [Ignavibacteriales bacterium]